jgi:hypothetical protein
MKYRTLCFSFSILIFSTLVNCQNLVPNASFEEFESCPEFSGEIEKAIGWMNFKLSPDYFNSCNETGMGVPTNIFSEYIEALHGNAYAGFGQIFTSTGHGELVAIELSSPLDIGVSYYVSLNVARGVPSTSNCWTNKIGVKFTMNGEYLPWPLISAMPISNSAHIYTDELVEDTQNWTTIDGYFTADSAYRFLVIGNHFDLDSLNIVCDQNYENFQAYYFLDCVCVSHNPETCNSCDVVLGSDEKLIDIVRVFPNPFEDYIQIENVSIEKLIEIEIWSITGKKEFGKGNPEFLSNGMKINVSDLTKGFYIVVLRFKDDYNKSFKLIKLKS